MKCLNEVRILILVLFSFSSPFGLKLMNFPRWLMVKCIVRQGSYTNEKEELTCAVDVWTDNDQVIVSYVCEGCENLQQDYI
ncbi:hypothetical protein HanPSC8_Chr10g0442461 [Helianthus annuus]|nr:hypothetical protein HanPSC8_Chr10g0442461 [Helianthus annuus]